MISFLLMIFMIWLIVRCVGALSCPAPRGRWALRGFDNKDEAPRATSREPRTLPSPAARVETPLERLQREFASGTITVEQYEHEVGRLYGVREQRPLDGSV